MVFILISIIIIVWPFFVRYIISSNKKGRTFTIDTIPEAFQVLLLLPILPGQNGTGYKQVEYENLANLRKKELGIQKKAYEQQKEKSNPLECREIYEKYEG